MLNAITDTIPESEVERPYPIQVFQTYHTIDPRTGCLSFMYLTQIGANDVQYFYYNGQCEPCKDFTAIPLKAPLQQFKIGVTNGTYNLITLDTEEDRALWEQSRDTLKLIISFFSALHDKPINE